LPGRPFKTIRDKHEIYKLAVVTLYAWRDDPRGSVSRGLLNVLVGLWPRESGDGPGHYDDHVAAIVSRMGAGPDEIAAAWPIKRDAAERKARRGLARMTPDPDYDPATGGRIVRPWIRVITGEEARGLLPNGVEILEQPLNPCTEEALSAAVTALDGELDRKEVAQARERMNRAFALSTLVEETARELVPDWFAD
jgi:hypothetical protein